VVQVVVGCGALFPTCRHSVPTVILHTVGLHTPRVGLHTSLPRLLWTTFTTPHTRWVAARFTPHTVYTHYTGSRLHLVTHITFPGLRLDYTLRLVRWLLRLVVAQPGFPVPRLIVGLRLRWIRPQLIVCAPPSTAHVDVPSIALRMALRRPASVRWLPLFALRLYSRLLALCSPALPHCMRSASYPPLGLRYFGGMTWRTDARICAPALQQTMGDTVADSGGWRAGVSPSIMPHWHGARHCPTTASPPSPPPALHTPAPAACHSLVSCHSTL